MSDEVIGSAAQHAKFDKFLTLPNASDLLVACQFVVDAAELDWEEVGVRWGITVCASNTSALRLNVGNRLLLDARPDGDFELFIVHPVDRPALWGQHVEAYKGFEQVKDSVWLLLKGLEELAEVLDEPGLAEEVKAHADASGRALPRSEWHNPLVESLFEDVESDFYEPAADEDIDFEDDDQADEELDDLDLDDEDGNRPVTDFYRPADDNAAAEDLGHLTGHQSGGDTMHTPVIELKGRGSKKSRPFDIDRTAEYFLVRWSGSDNETSVSVVGLPPYSCFESFEGAKGEGIIYESGRFYVEVDSEGDWSLNVEAHLTAPESSPVSGVVASFSGEGDAKTRPFVVPKGTEYFVVRWTGSNAEVDVTVHGIEPTSSFDWFKGGRTGEGLVYESGRFYAEIETEGSWKLEVVTE